VALKSIRQPDVVFVSVALPLAPGASSVGASAHRQTNTEGQFFNAFHQGTYSSVNLLHYPAKNVLVGGELLYGKNEQKGGQTATDHRLQFSAQFRF